MGKGLSSFIFIHLSQCQALNKSILSRSHISQVEPKTRMFSRFRVLKESPWNLEAEHTHTHTPYHVTLFSVTDINSLTNKYLTKNKNQQLALLFINLKPSSCMRAKSLQCLPLCDPMDHSPPGSSDHGILQARILEWVAMPPPGDLPDPAIKPLSLMSLALAGGFFTTSATWEAHLIPSTS